MFKDSINNNLANIRISDAMMLDYIDNKLSKLEQQQVEDAMQNDPLLKDAIEGMLLLKSNEKIVAVSNSVNHNLTNWTKGKRARKNNLSEVKNIMIFVVIILIIIIIIGYFFAYMNK